MNFSIEIGPKTDLGTLPSLKDIYITFLPGGDFKETADKAEELVKKGCNPIPHFPARSIENSPQLKEYVSRCKDVGVKQLNISNIAARQELRDLIKTVNLPGVTINF